MRKVLAFTARLSSGVVLAYLALVYGKPALCQGSLHAPVVVIEVAGDVLPQSPHRVIPDAPHIFEGVQDVFARSDLVFVNLEEPITPSSQITPHKNQSEVKAGRDYILRARDISLPGSFKQAGIGLVGLANNHMLDYTPAGLEDTLRAFRRAGLPVVGAGLKAEAERAFVLDKNGVRVALLAFSDVVPPHTQATNRNPGVASSKRLGNLNNAIWRAHQQADFVVLMIHWGGQGSHLITRRQQEVARAAVRAGCDVIIGMHPHVLQGVEYIGRVPVFYSVGNFAYPSTGNDNSECVLVRLTFGTKILESIDLIPVAILRDGMPKEALGDKGGRILGHLDQFCRMFNTRIEKGRVLSSPVREELLYDSTDRKENTKAKVPSRKLPRPPREG